MDHLPNRNSASSSDDWNQILYATESYGRDPKDAAMEFARNYFGEPRKIRWSQDGSFRLVGGNRVYRVRHQNQAAPCTYQIVVA